MLIPPIYGHLLRVRNMDFGVEGNTALGIASSSGLGKASMYTLAAEGANVVINGRDRDRLNAAVEEIKSVATGSVLGVAGDITNPDDIDNLVDRTVEEFGELDHLVISSGGPPRRTFGESTDQEWYDAYDLMIMSAVRTIRAARPHLESGTGGSIVCITSRRTKEASPNNILSSSVRMCIPGLMKALSRDLAPAVRVNEVRPGPFTTPRNDPSTWDQKRQSIPLDRLGDPLEFGQVVAFLSSDRSGYLTGASIPVDGGSTHATL